MDSIPSPQTILTMHNKLTMAMLPASVKNSQDYDSRDFLFWLWSATCLICWLKPIFYQLTLVKT